MKQDYADQRELLKKEKETCSSISEIICFGISAVMAYGFIVVMFCL